MSEEKQITNTTEETDPKRRSINKKLSEMSKEAKGKRKLKTPPKDENIEDSGCTSIESKLSINYTYVFGAIGIIIALVNLYYTRKSVVGVPKDEKKEGRKKREVGTEPKDTPRAPDVEKEKQQKKSNSRIISFYD